MISPSAILNARILVVDDQEAYVLLLERMLRGAGYAAIESTTDSKAVCELHRKNRYDLILLDLRMPGMDGFQVMEALKEIESGETLPVLVITAEPDHKLRALNAGARDFVSKPFDLAELLARVHNMLEIHLLHLGTRNLEARVAADQEAVARKVAEQLLLNALPHAVAERFRGRPGGMAVNPMEGIAERFAELTVLFAGIVGFTRFSEGMSAEVLVGVLNDIFTRFDDIAVNRGAERINAMGEAYMAAAGLPVPVADHAVRTAHMALDMLDAMVRFNEENHCRLEIRIGIGTGAAVAGLIGKRRFLYDLWGEAVNAARQLESRGLPGRIRVTDATRRRLGAPFMLEKAGAVDVGGAGETHAWFLTGRDG